jgi:hypothetical protein
MAEMHAFTSAAEWLSMATNGKGLETLDPDSLEANENLKMHNFLGEQGQYFAFLVTQTTGSYVKQCGYDSHRK